MLALTFLVVALAIWRHDGDLSASMPYPDVAEVLRSLKACGTRIGIVSDIHYHLRPHFEHYGLGHLVDVYTLSFEHGVQNRTRACSRSLWQRLGWLHLRPLWWVIG